ncbi:FERM domain-containing protein 1 isoform X3 [Choloepus didactylus]|uniref:FERM domain-containing protein 1 isoform X3 n=1 Tax=Choloepus didactylus TaxID=27675 RepID=UPI0018A117B2|nr:FERM domain-containing protein 1 isoform X3 [Choloepus didactylus]
MWAAGCCHRLLPSRAPDLTLKLFVSQQGGDGGHVARALRSPGLVAPAQLGVDSGRGEMAAEWRNVVVLLPNRDQLRLAVGVKATGRELFQQVCELMSMKEAHFFGLSVVRNNEYLFMDLDQKLSKYFSKDWKKEGYMGNEKSSAPFVAFLRVQYYVENGRVISDKIARLLYYHHLKEKVLRSECVHQEESYFLLAAYGLQADLGNHREAAHVGKYFEPYTYFPQWIIAKRGSNYILRHAPAMHREQRGLNPKEAVLRFIREACRLEDVPVHFFRLQKDKKEERPSVVLGLTLKGIHIYQEVNHTRRLLYDFPWSHVGKLAFLGKKFEIQPSGLPSARKLVYYTGCPFRSQHLLRLLSSSHRLYLSVQPLLRQPPAAGGGGREEALPRVLRQRRAGCGPGPGRQAVPRQWQQARAAAGSRPQPDLPALPPGAHGSSHTSGIEADARHPVCVEMSVDEPFGMEVATGQGQSDSSTGSLGSSGSTEGAAPGRGDASPRQPLAVVHIALVKTRGRSDEALHQLSEVRAREDAARHSQSVDDVRLPRHRKLPPAATLSSPAAHSYTFGCSLEDGRVACGCDLSTADGKTKSAFSGKRSMNCVSLDLLGGDGLPEEFVV